MTPLPPLAPISPLLLRGGRGLVLMLGRRQRRGVGGPLHQRHHRRVLKPQASTPWVGRLPCKRVENFSPLAASIELYGMGKGWISGLPHKKQTRLMLR